MSFANIEKLKPILMTEQYRPIQKLDLTDELVRQMNQSALDDFDLRLAQSKKGRIVEGD